MVRVCEFSLLGRKKMGNRNDRCSRRILTRFAFYFYLFACFCFFFVGGSHPQTLKSFFDTGLLLVQVGETEEAIKMLKSAH